MGSSESFPQLHRTIPTAGDEEAHLVQVRHTRNGVVMRWNRVDHLTVLHVVRDAENKG